MKRKIFSLISIFVFIFSFVGCSCKKEEIERGSIEVPMISAYQDKDINGRKTYVYPFNTIISLTYFYKSDKERVSEYFVNEYSSLHTQFDRHYYYFDDNGHLINNLRVINESNGSPITVSEDLISIFKEGIKFTKLSNGKFNIGIGNLSDLWDKFISIGNISRYIHLTNIDKFIYENGEYIEDMNGTYILINDVYVDISEMKKYNYVDNHYIENSEGHFILVKDIAPSEEQIRQAKLCTPSVENIEDIIVIDDINNTITINSLSGCNGSVSVTLGALAKSYVAEKIATNEDIKNGNFLINAGQSTIKILGENLARDNGDWNVGITDSYLVYSGESKNASYLLKLSDPISVSTSSGDEKHYFYKEKYYHHIIDPISGYPNQDRFAVTAITSNAMYADIITTSCMNMDMNETKEYLSTLKENNINVDVFIQDKENDMVKVYVTSNMNDLVSIRENEDYKSYLDSIVIEEFSYDS